MKAFFASLCLGLALAFRAGGIGAESGNRFVFAQLKVPGDPGRWDPYPLASRDILAFLQQTTSVKVQEERRVLSLSDPALFQSPFLLYSGFGSFSWNPEEREILKRYLSGGGFLLVEDRAGEKNGSFDHAFRREIKKVFPDKDLSVIPMDHAVFRSYYLLRTVGGRKLTRNALEGLELDGRMALVYSQNDLIGAWAKDLFGNYVHDCPPGGEAQRWNAQKLTLNLIVYSVTGNYKTDMIHHPFIEEKMRR
jgi:hypothetical protein